MSMLSEQVKELKLFAKKSKDLGRKTDERIFGEAAGTIEALSAKLAAANMEQSDRHYGGGWIACEDRLPEDMEDVLIFFKATIDGGTHDGEEILSFGIGYYLEYDKEWVFFTSKHIKDYPQKVIAWQTLPEPYRP